MAWMPRVWTYEILDQELAHYSTEIQGGFLTGRLRRVEGKRMRRPGIVHLLFLPNASLFRTSAFLLFGFCAGSLLQ